MAQSNPFPHIQLKLVTDAPQKKRKTPRELNPRTAYNKAQRVDHAEILGASMTTLREEWQEEITRRQQEGLPDIPEAISIFLKIDPSSLPVDDLRKFGIEVIGELEDGYIIGASSDVTLSSLAAKINAFAAAGQNNVAALWEIATGTAWRYERILSPALLAEWPQIRDQDQFVIDVGVACLGMTHVPEHPNKRRDKYKSEENYLKALEKWNDKRDQAYDIWSELALERYDKLADFVNKYQGEILTGMIDGDHDPYSQLPDCFTCRINISGKGLRDLRYLFFSSESCPHSCAHSEYLSE
ncbi:MAG: hypothetical protein VR69_01455 [Peptococcaceae bacterium BRH_c4b]|nr:MAG: hypothetical protein VR69_01455 [Peptococcaceae bacterium BRH_c4b]